MAWLSFGKQDIGAELRDIKVRLGHIERTTGRIERTTELNLEADMATNDELKALNDTLTEAATEIPALINQLIEAAGDQADPELIATARAKAQALADIVPNPEPPVEPETPSE